MREIININTKWAFSKEAEQVPEKMPEKWYWVTLPHTWNAIDGQDGGNDYYRGVAYYAKEIDRTDFPKADQYYLEIQGANSSADVYLDGTKDGGNDYYRGVAYYAKEIDRTDFPKADQYYLEIQGANSSADVYLDGTKIAHHDGGYSTWRIDLTDAWKEKSLLVIAVDNSENDFVYPQVADFTFYGGLYRDVNIVAVSHSHFDLEYYGGSGIRVTPTLIENDAKVEMEVFISNAEEGQKLKYVLKDQSGTIVADFLSDITDTKAVLDITNVHRWNGKKDPYLYTAEVSILCEDEILDQVSTRFPMRRKGKS